MAKYYRRVPEPVDQGWFDVGTCCFTVYPQTGFARSARTLSTVHLKRLQAQGRWLRLGKLSDGDVDWPAVRQAFAEIGYSGAPLRSSRAATRPICATSVAALTRLLLAARRRFYFPADSFTLQHRESPTTSCSVEPLLKASGFPWFGLRCHCQGQSGTGPCWKKHSRRW